MTSRNVEDSSPARRNPQQQLGATKRRCISTAHKKRITRQEPKQKRKLDPKRVTTFAGMVSAVLLVVKLLVEIIKLIFSHSAPTALIPLALGKPPAASSIAAVGAFLPLAPLGCLRENHPRQQQFF
ncbi:hypothetical protein Dxin01_01815 [Deinococcus xinjiangensis]|uniref:Uncharacterized protein n=1 Tax=Deinococcus xinjiangensis TaxID=457454 RepID=A0ABP9VBG8_9DEIO